MRYGFIIPGGDVRAIAELTCEAETAGWDGVFIPDCISIETKNFPASPWFDPWVVLAVMAMRTERVRIGTVVTAVSRRRPWKLARETATLDHLSNGRIILSVGLGAAEDDAGFHKVGEAMDIKVRARRLDEGLEVLAGLWSGRPFSYRGEHYNVEEMTMLPPPVQSPRIPIWVVGVWPRMKSMRRALRWDGVLPQKRRNDPSGFQVTPADIQAITKLVAEEPPRATPFDIVVQGETPGGNRQRAVETVGPFAEAGATWWMEAMWSSPPDASNLDTVRTRIQQGPPRLQ